MRPLGIVFRAAAVVVAIALVSSCGNKEAGWIMDSAEEVMWTRPDSALAALESIDTLSLKTKAQRARYSLLYTMALNKNWIDTSDMRVIQPAARYYERHGSKDDKMKMYYYLGTVQQNAGYLEAAVKSYLRAKEYSSNSDNLVFVGLISSAISDVYSENNNYPEALNYAKEALTLFSEAEDSIRIWRTTGSMLSLYVNMRDYEKSDSLFAVLCTYPCRDSLLYSHLLMNEALSCLWRPVPEPKRSIELFLKAINEFDGEPTPMDYCAYAYALELQDDRALADNIISQLIDQGCTSDVLDVWRYRICQHRGDFKEALSLLERSVKARDTEVFAAVNQSVALAQSDYYENKSELLIQERYIRNQRKWLFIMSVIILVFCLLTVYGHKKRKWARRIEEMSRINENVNRLLFEGNQINEDYRKRLEDMERMQSSLVDREVAIKELRSKYIRAYRAQLDRLVVLCSEYWESFGTSSDMERIYGKVKKIVSELEENDDDKLEAMIDEGLDGIMAKLRSDIPGMTEKDRKFIIYQILGFDAKTMSRVTGYSVESIYTKRNRLKKRIQSMESVNRDLYVEILC